MNLLITVTTLLLTFWLISLVWSRQVARRVFQVVLSLALIIIVIVGIYVGYQGYRWSQLIQRLNNHSITATEVINAPAISPNPS